MIKNYNKIAKVFTIIFIILFTMSSFGAVISDNDGAAFVTKAEFEALKMNFEDQIINYNDSIDGKIDGAISSYLAGTRLTSKENKKIFFANWNYVTMLNGTIANDWKAPNVNLSITYAGVTPFSSDYTGWATKWWAIGALSYVRSAMNYAKRIIVDAGPENNANEYATWIGRSCNLVDSISLSRIGTFNTGAADLGHIAWPDSGKTQTFAFINATQIQPGYYSDLDGLEKTIWNPRFQWISNKEGYTAIKEYENCISKSNAFSIELNKVNNKTYDFEHILNWENYIWPQVTDTDWTKSLRAMDTTTYTRKYVLTNATKSSKWSGKTVSSRANNTRREASVTYGSIPTTNFSAYYSGNYGADDNTAFVGVGLVNHTYDSEHIYQSDTKFTETVGKSEFKADKLSLIKGLPLLASKMDDKITIELEFDNAYRNGTAVTNMDCDVFLSLVPFGEGSTVTDETKRIRCDGQDADKDYMTTTNNKIKLEWTMPEDGIVYIKWRPHDTTGTWQVDLDLTKNPTYIVESATF